MTIEERHWDLWAHNARNRYGGSPGWYAEQCWAVDGAFRDHEDEHPTHPPEDEDIAERLGRAVQRLPMYARNVLIAWHRAFPNAPAQPHICALTLRVDPEYMRDNWQRLHSEVELLIEGCTDLGVAV